MLREQEARLLRSFVKNVSSLADRFGSIDRKFDTIKLQIDAIAENTQATKKNTEPKPQLPVTVNTEIKLPPAISNYYSAKANRKPRKRVPEWLAFVVSLLTLLILAIYTCMTYKQWQASIEGNVTSRNNLVISQRAYLAGGKVDIEPYGINIAVVNVGHVPATITAVNFTFVRFSADKTGTKTLETKVVQSTTIRSVIMPAPVTNFGMVVTLPILSAPDQAQVDLGVQHLAVTGSITYEAGFDNTEGNPILETLNVHTGYESKTTSWTHVEEGLPINFRETQERH